MNCLIVDDERTARELIKSYCDVCKINVLAEFSNGVEALKWLTENKVDLILLDIHMPIFTGIDLIKTLPQKSAVVLTTSDSDFALESYSYSTVVDYLLKPVTLERFKKAIDKVLKKGKVEKESKPKSGSLNLTDEVFVNIDKRLVRLRLDDILFAKSDGDYLLIYLEKETLRVQISLSKFLNKLPGNSFFRVHRSYLINSSKIVDIEMNSILIDKHVIPISRRRRPELMKFLNLM